MITFISAKTFKRNAGNPRSAFSVTALIALLLPVAPYAICEDAIDFDTQVKQAMAKYKDFFEEENKKVLNDQLLDANADLMRRADQERSPIFDFVAANMMYSMDPDRSFVLHQRTHQAYPDEPSVNLEWAMECHRRGDIAGAIPAYELFLKSKASSERYWSLLADCYVRTGKLDEAIDAWQKARHGSNHTEIDFAIYEIYGGVPPLRKRAELLKAFENGDQTVAEALVLQDLSMEDDWWNTHVYKDGLRRDLDRVSRALGQDSQRYRELAALAEMIQNEKLEAKDVSDQLTKMHLLVEGGNLPMNSLVASHYIALALKNKVVRSAELLARFAKELEQRAITGTGDVEALNVLCTLYSDTENWTRVQEFDALGWEKFHEVRFVTSFLLGLARDEKLKIDTPEFVKALKEYPENNLIQSIRLHLVGSEHLTADDIAGAIKAEYRLLSVRIAIRDSYTLKGYFAVLKKLRER
jgi:tetratricopeptide (TPR) repeat protein